MGWTKEAFAKFAPRPKSGTAQHIWDAYVGELIESGEHLFLEFGIDKAEELHAWLANVAHETDGFTIWQENMSYAHADRIMEIFGVGHHSAAITHVEAAALVHKPEALAERVYGLGNPRKAKELGNTDPGDGFKYRGTGPMQTTGRSDHERLFGGEATVLATIRAAMQEWEEKGCNELACSGQFKTTVKKINGGYNGLQSRIEWLKKAQRVWPALPFDHAEQTDAKPALASNQIQAGSASSLASLYTAQSSVKMELAAAATPEGVNWSKLLLGLLTNDIFLASVVALITALGVIWFRARKPDIKAW